MNADASVYCVMRHINFSVDPGVKYLIGGPTISALASAPEQAKGGMHGCADGEIESINKSCYDVH